MGALKAVELYTKTKGRPCLYDFSPFLNKKQAVVIIQCSPTEDIYNSIKSTFARWRKRHGIPAGFVFNIYDEYIVIWRRQTKKL
jgi:hypothetical protein